MLKTRIISLLLIVSAIALGFFVYNTEKNESNFAFKLGLDLSGGTELVYEADLSGVDEGEEETILESLRDVIERRVTSQDVAGVLGVLDPVVQVEKTGIISGETKHRLLIELPGVTDLDKAKEFINETPLLEFKLLDSAKAVEVAESGEAGVDQSDLFIATGLTGQFLDDARFELLDTGLGFIEPVVTLQFNSEGSDLFGEITRENVGEILAIFLDGEPISTPVVNEEIRGGQAQISGDFTRETARELAENLKLGATPVPISLAGAQTIGPTLGQETVEKGVKAGAMGLLIIALFLIIWYRLPGFTAVLSLSLYILIMLSLFKVIPVTLTASGIAGFILSVGMAVDANILIFERLKEELKKKEDLREAIKESFRRAWLSIRDANISSFIIAIILFYLFQHISLVRGFAVVFGIGVLVSMFTAILATRVFLLSVSKQKIDNPVKLFFGNGLPDKKENQDL